MLSYIQLHFITQISRIHYEYISKILLKIIHFSSDIIIFNTIKL